MPEHEANPAPAAGGPHRRAPIRGAFALRPLVALAAGAVACGLADFAPTWAMRMAVGWNVGGAVLLVLWWSVILTINPAETRRRAGMDDPGRAVTWALALSASAFSLFAATHVLAAARDMGVAGDRRVWTAVGGAAVVVSWLVTHTGYALRYAHLYYHRKISGEAHLSSGLEFPGGGAPCDLDFAYFAFTLGVCFQTSDVQVNCTRIRRAVLAHVLLAFAYNTIIIGLVVSILGDLLK